MALQHDRESVSSDYVIHTLNSLEELPSSEWDALLATQDQPTPFMCHAYLVALHASGSATKTTGWKPTILALRDDLGLAAACVVYRKDHSYGEYVFDWAWANAYAQHGLQYYPKAVVSVPFTPVPGSRLLARDGRARDALLRAILAWCQDKRLSSLHVLFGSPADLAAGEANGLMQRHTVQFHWQNKPAGYADFEDFLMSLTQEKRKKIRQERRKVLDAGVHFEALQGTEISRIDWDFFYRCYERTYLEHGNAPYLTRDFFDRLAQSHAQHWLLFVARREGKAIASSLIGLMPPSTQGASNGVAYGRYWGALERVDCLHFEACYYQPLQWCIQHRYARFEGGAQGEHKMARALLPVKTSSSHWLAHPAFAQAIERFLEREGDGIANYLEHLDARSPLKEI